jgi:hypothetical protein
VSGDIADNNGGSKKMSSPYSVLIIDKDLIISAEKLEELEQYGFVVMTGAEFTASYERIEVNHPQHIVLCEGKPDLPDRLPSDAKRLRNAKEISREYGVLDEADLDST